MVASVSACALLAPGANADRLLSIRFAATEHGQVTLAANALETCTPALPSCTAARSGTGTPADNGQFLMGYVDVDSDATTFNSSTANLTLPSGATVLWAGLYWAGDTSAGNFGAGAPSPSSRGQVRFAAPGATYGTVAATSLDTDATSTTSYQGFADVTAQVRAAGSGTYRIANVQAGTGVNRWAGWGLVIAYRDAGQPLRRLHVYDGLRAVQSGAPAADIALGDFVTPASGTVRGRLGLLSWEGDRGLTGDGATLGTRALSDALNPAGDVFNSTIARDGSSITARDPAYLNAMSLDADELSIDGALSNGATSSVLHLTTTTERYLVGAIALAADEGPPINRTSPSVTGTPRDGTALAADRGTWDGTPTIGYSYQWRRCNAAGNGCADIAAATSSTYMPGADDVGSTLRVAVTATNEAGATTATSAATAAVAASAPVNTAAPTVSGAARDGATLTADRGTWTGTAPITYGHQWRRCDAAGAGCANIAGATATTYTLTSADVGATIRVAVSATNAAGSTSAVSTQTAPVAAAAPANTAAPTIPGSARDGATLTAAPGTWTGTPPLTYAYQWQRCDADGTSCADLAGATAATYVAASEDIGHALRVRVSATNAAGGATAVSAATAAVTAAAPSNTALPAITGTTRDGQTLTASRGTWTGTPPIAYAYQWRRCNASGNGCADIAGATASTYTLVAADVGSTVRVRVTASNTGGSASADSATSGTVAAAAPVNTTPPTISGTAREGESVTAQPGSWSGTPPLTYAYQWQRCDLSGSNCADIAGATGQSYTLTVADVAGRVRVRVTATNAGGAASAFSAPASVNPAAPSSTAPPTISGTARDGQTLTASDGTWGGTPPFSYVRQWLRCDASSTSCTAIGGATAATYTLTSADVASTIRVVVAATNAAGSAQSTSSPTGTVAGNAPTVSSPPTVSGSPRDGLTLTADRGTWSGSTPLSHAYQWRRCDADGGGCADIASATQLTYTLTAGDVDHTVRVAVTASNTAGSATAGSAATERVGATGPALADAPTVSGTARDGSALTTDHGTWSGTPPIAYAYRWQRCDADGTGCTDIARATESTYTSTADDVDRVVRVQVTATNAGGSATASSAPTPRVAARAPANTSPPSVSGTARDGATLTADRGTWNGTSPLSYAYRWQRCDASGEACADIPGASETSYELKSADVGATVRVAVTATNVAGSTTEASAATALVAPSAPANTTAPRVTGLARDGELLTATRGVWSGTPPFTYAYRWQRCDAGGDGCVDIAGATAATYRLAADDVDHTVRVLVTATNAGGEATEPSAPTDQVASAPPQSTAAPMVSGTARDASTLTADHGMWTGTPPLSYAYRWQRCEPDGGTCADIDGATGPTYELTPADVGKAVRVAVTATNAGGAATAASPSTAIVAALAPANTSAPTISGTPRDGRRLSADRGSWSGTPPIAYAYQWRRCDPSGAACQDIVGATGSTYDPTPAEVGATVRVLVTASNTGGSATATSAATDRVDAEGPDSTAPPSISGEARDGETLTADPGTWTGTPPIAYAYRWLRCEADGNGCADIAGATERTYTIASSDADSTIRVVVTATNGGGSASERSSATAAVAANAPVSTGPPGVSGSPRDGELLTAAPGAWSGTTPIDVAYRWQRCDAGGASCADIDGGDGQRYRLTSDDVGHAVRVMVTATNAAGSAETPSAVTAVVQGIVPSNEQAPAISRAPERGATLSASGGTWSGTQPIDHAYRWERCDEALASCDVISGATDSTYTLADDDVDHRIRVVVTASNVAGRAEATSPATARVTGAPRNVTAPSISGDARDASTLTAGPGDWRGSQPIAYAYHWQRCDAQGADCQAIPGATEPTYQLTADDVGHRIVLEVRATNRDGEATVSSPATPAVAAVPPTNTEPPAITGTPRDGRTLTADRGAWTGTPTITYAYEWQRCRDDGSRCENIDGGTEATYTLTSRDAGHAIRVRVTATNDAGPASATSAATAVVAANPPASHGPPTVDGTPRLGQTLTADRGAWTGTTPIDYAYRWQRCDASASTCVDIPGATAATYTLTDDDLDRRLRVAVTATNTAGTDSATSPATAEITAAPAVLTAPSISGDARERETLIADPGTWSGSQPMTFTYRWQRCDVGGGGCADIEDATEQTYEVVADDVGHALVVEVTATNSTGSTSRVSAPTAPVTTAAPSPTPTPTPTPPPASPPEAPVAAASGAPTAGDLSSLPGSLVAARACQTLSGGTRVRSLTVAGVGRVLVRAAAGSAIVPDAPLRISISGPRGRPFKPAATLDRSRLRLSGSNPWTATLKPSQLGTPRTRTLRVRVKPPHGRARTATLRLRLGACGTTFTARQSRTARGTSLRLRVDSRAPLSRLAFAVPTALTLRGGRRDAPAGRVRIATLGAAPRTVSLTLPAGKRAGVLASGGGITVGFSARGFTVWGLPTNTGIVDLRLAEPATAAHGGVLKLRAAVSSTSGQSTLSVRVRGVVARR
jgi:hypothetical protein